MPEWTPSRHNTFDPPTGRADLEALLSEAGFDEPADTTAFVHHRGGRDYPVFLVSGRRRG